MTSTFKDTLRSIVSKESLNSMNWKSDSWKYLVTNINQEVLNDAFLQHEKLQNIFKTVGTIIPRKCKQMSRINLKTDEVSNRGSEYFKVVSDFVAGRIHCDVSELPKKIELIRGIVNKNGSLYVRGESKDNVYGFCHKDGKFTDITQYVYVYLDEVGYIAELQIGHEFATYTFTIDSMIRDNPNCGKVDLWKNDFYCKVKNYILKKANNVEIQAGEKYDLFDLAHQIHNYNVPNDLKTILDKI